MACNTFCKYQSSVCFEKSNLTFGLWKRVFQSPLPQWAGLVILAQEH